MRALVLPALLALAACGPTSSTEVASTTQALETLVTNHTAAPVTPDTCASQMAAYQQQAGELLSNLGTMCAGMEGHMGHHHHHGEMGTAVSDMQSELAHHAASACASGDLAGAMSAHQAAMSGHCDHLRSLVSGAPAHAPGGMGMGGHGCK